MIDITAEALRKMPLPEPGEGDKTARGEVLVIAGSRQVPGAALLSGVAALRAGAGRLRIATCTSNAPALAVAVPEAFVLGLSETAAGGIDPSNVDELLGIIWPAPGSEDTEFGVLMEPEVRHGEAEVYAGVQA